MDVQIVQTVVLNGFSVKEGSTEHKVTFDYGSEVKGIEKLILLLRNQRIALSKKYLKSN